MPRKTKEQSEKNTTEKEVKKADTKATTKKSSGKVKTTEKTNIKTKAVEKVNSAKQTKTTKSVKTKATKKADSSARSTKKTTKSRSTSATKKKAPAKKASKTTAKKLAIPIVEYYDLPYRYNQTVVKLLAQTPTSLFVYWDISDDDRNNYKELYGENFFEQTKPVLIIHNTTLDYSFEVEINDFANSWYLHVNDSKCDYSIELGRRPISNEVKSKIDTDYIYISSSNIIESPNDKILFNNTEHKVYFRNVKTNVTSAKSISFIKNMGKIYNIYDLYKTIYKEEILEDLSSSMFK